MSESSVLCPSWGCEPGASLIGIVLPNGTVAFSNKRIVIDAEFVEAARSAGAPEKRFRFSSTCKRAACIQWADERCGRVDAIVEQHEGADPDAPFALPECAMRPQCRWHLQSGVAACRACPEIITDRS
jgi:hypothetical protein